jgi:hypothetical protein
MPQVPIEHMHPAIQAVMRGEMPAEVPEWLQIHQPEKLVPAAPVEVKPEEPAPPPAEDAGS